MEEYKKCLVEIKCNAKLLPLQIKKRTKNIEEIKLIENKYVHYWNPNILLKNQ